jgi:hypothetical protein
MKSPVQPTYAGVSDKTWLVPGTIRTYEFDRLADCKPVRLMYNVCNQFAVLRRMNGASQLRR